MLNDPTLMVDQCAWLTNVLTARGVPAAALTHGLHALVHTAPPGEHHRALLCILQSAQHNVSATHLHNTPDQPDSAAAPRASVH